MRMEIPKSETVKLDAKVVKLFAKVSDSGSYELLDVAGNSIAEREDYVPSFFPGEHYGDYIDLHIDLETGMILNWEKPKPEEVSKAFKLFGVDEE